VNGIVLAYDGSTHGDWVGRCAIRLARAARTGLEVLHVDDGALSGAEREGRLSLLSDVAAASGVEVALRHLPQAAAGVAPAIEAAVPAAAGHVLVSGLRARTSARGLLRGTVAEQLLRLGRHDVLFSLSQNPHSATRAAPS